MVSVTYPCPRTHWRSTSSFQVEETFIQFGEERRSRTWASIDMHHVCHGSDVEPRQCIRNSQVQHVSCMFVQALSVSVYNDITKPWCIKFPQQAMTDRTTVCRVNPLPAVHTWIRRTRRIRFQRQLRVCFDCTCWLTGFDLLQLCSSFRGSKKNGWLHLIFRGDCVHKLGSLQGRSHHLSSRQRS